MKSVIFLSEKVVNKNHKFGEVDAYFPAFVQDEDGNKKPALFTENQIEVAINRASRNMEDIPGEKDQDSSFIGKLFSIFSF